jgi:Tfp pilus assembly protein PilX
MNRRYSHAPGARARRGAALVTSLMILLVLTILGIAAMRTASLEERMAGNVQEAVYAFEAAESGLNAALNDAANLSLSGAVENTYSIGNAVAETRTEFLQFSPPKRGSGYSATSYDSANFNQRSTGKVGVASATVHRGIGQIVPKSQ